MVTFSLSLHSHATNSCACTSTTSMFYLFLLLSLVSTGCECTLASRDQLLYDAVEERVFPWAVALVVDEGGVFIKLPSVVNIWSKNTNGATKFSPERVEPIFDMASCTSYW